MLDIAYRKSVIDQDTQRLDVRRYLAMDTADDPARRARRALRIVGDLEQPEQKASA
ncbi:hypothetical protein [Nocardia altamirensis]|uniref:hypothetical protein n=1 Tax=Nocardia altamirensis TaxID=472158 RepID=UPI0014354E31|nr:hypothetical protein [Nocardia altamirensis]